MAASYKRPVRLSFTLDQRNSKLAAKCKVNHSVD